MITDHMTLTTIRDAYTWASQFDLTDAQIERLGDWIWDNKPKINCTYAEHPLYELESDTFWEIAGDENHDDYNDAVATGGYDVIEWGGAKYAVTRQPELSNRVFPGWWGDAATGDGYTAEWSAPAIGQDGGDYLVVWQFDDVKGDDGDASDYDWDDITDVKRA